MHEFDCFLVSSICAFFYVPCLNRAFQAGGRWQNPACSGCPEQKQLACLKPSTARPGAGQLAAGHSCFTRAKALLARYPLPKGSATLEVVPAPDVAATLLIDERQHIYSGETARDLHQVRYE